MNGTDYRSQLIALEQKAQESYDKTVLTLSGGALGVSFAFVSNFVERDSMVCPGLLFSAWVAWAFSLACALASHFASCLALRRAVQELDRDRSVQRPGRRYDRFTGFFNLTAGVLCVAGMLLLVTFVWRNV
jgi:hypothetical protein